MAKEKKIFGFGKNVTVAGLVSFFMDMSSEMIYPLVPCSNIMSDLDIPASGKGGFQPCSPTLREPEAANAGMLMPGNRQLT